MSDLKEAKCLTCWTIISTEHIWWVARHVSLHVKRNEPCEILKANWEKVTVNIQ